MWLTILVAGIIYIILFLSVKTIRSVSKELYETSTFKIKKFVTDPSKVNNVISVILAIVSLIIAFSEEAIQFISEFLGDYVVQIVLIFLILLIWMLYRMSSKNDRIIELENDMRSSTKGLWKNYSDLSKFYKDKNLLELMKVFVKSHSYVSSVQRYRYYIQDTEKHITITLRGINHYIDEGTDLNTVSQAYFNYDKKKVNELIQAYTKATISEKTKSVSDDDYNKLFSFFKDKVEDLLNIDADDIQDKDAFTYQLVKIAQLEIQNGLGDKFQIEFGKDKIDQLDKRKSGIEIATFLLREKIGITNEYQSFKYKGNSDSKRQRMYSNIQVENELGEQFVFVLSHHSEELWDEVARLEQIRKDAQDFVDLIQSEAYSVR